MSGMAWENPEVELPDPGGTMRELAEFNRIQRCVYIYMIYYTYYMISVCLTTPAK